MSDRRYRVLLSYRLQGVTELQTLQGVTELQTLQGVTEL